MLLKTFGNEHYMVLVYLSRTNGCRLHSFYKTYRLFIHLAKRLFNKLYELCICIRNGYVFVMPSWFLNANNRKEWFASCPKIKSDYNNDVCWIINAVWMLINVNKMNIFPRRRNALWIDSVSRKMGLIVFLLQINIVCLAQEDIKVNKINTEHNRPRHHGSIFSSPGKS